jgi:polyisoprenyl-teichoic acid--peptidoglycan teichoic acid transferase
VLVLSLAVASPLAWAAQTAYVARHDVLGIFAGNKVKSDGTDVTAEDPFASKPRLNLLILGGDAAENRTGVRTDSIMVASVDTHTGRTLLISLPRNLNKAPFRDGTPMDEAFPDGFQCQPEINCYLNSVFQYGEQHPGMVGHETRHPGADLLAQTVGEMLGMKIDYYVLAQIFGFRDIVDALGGVTIRVTERIPVGGREEGGVIRTPPSRYIEPGLQHLDGTDAMWYARSRFGSTDYERMIRQRCMLGAIARQVNPARVLLSFNELASAAKELVSTDLPAELMPALVKLAVNGKSAKIVGASIDHSVFGSSNSDPDYRAIRKESRRLLAAEAAITTSTSPTASPTRSGSQAPQAPAPASLTRGSGAATDLFSSGQCSYS